MFVDLRAVDPADHDVNVQRLASARLNSTRKMFRKNRKFSAAPFGAIEKMQRTGRTVCDVDAFEINEAFAMATMVAPREVDIPHAKVNAHGSTCALGHPVGASGARILVTGLSAPNCGGEVRIAGATPHQVAI
jgi:acetyl-CoA acetyltransferase